MRSAGQRQLRLRVLTRARAAGASALGHQRRRWRVVLGEDECKAIAAAGSAEIDLAAQEVRYDGQVASFEIDPEIKHRLLGGLDDIALSLQQGDAIAAYESDRERSGPVTTAL